MSAIDSLLDVFFPHDCVGCGAEGKLLCNTCSQKLPPAQSVEADGLTSIRSATLYEGMAKDLIWKLKSSGVQAAAVVMARHMASLAPRGDKCLIVPVPTATSRVRQRGYDQAKLLARALARQTGHTYRDCLARHGQAHQVGASRGQRLTQLAGTLRVRRRVKGVRIILVDDVTTTGATLEVAAAVLKKAHALRVEAITFAYKPKNFK